MIGVREIPDAATRYASMPTTSAGINISYGNMIGY
jgi:hypothetical protein